MDPNNALQGNVPTSMRDDWSAYGESSRSQASDGTLISAGTFSPSRNAIGADACESGRCIEAPGAGFGAGGRSPPPPAVGPGRNPPEDWTQTPVRGGQRYRPFAGAGAEGASPPLGSQRPPPRRAGFPLGEFESGCFRLETTADASRSLLPCPRTPGCLTEPDAVSAASAAATAVSKEASRQLFNSGFSVVVSTVMMLAYKDFPVPDAHKKWTRDFLNLIKDDEGQVPPNIAGILWELDSTDPSTRARQASARR